MSFINEETKDFARLLEESLEAQKYFNKGERATVSVISITPDKVFVDVSGKREGFINTLEFVDENNSLSINAGDKIETFFDGTQDGMMRFTTLINGQPLRVIEYLENCFTNEIYVKGLVVREIKGGYEINVKNVRCFCPHSQIGFKNENQDYIGKTFDFKIIDYKKDSLGIVLSRRAVLDQLKRQTISELKERLKIGDDVKVQVKTIKNFGIFADIGGIEGFIPHSELSWGRIEKIDELFNEGQMIDAKIISIDFDKEKIMLSCKALQIDPWLNIETRYPVGSRVSAKILKIMPFGVFVSIEDGIEGLVHISNLATGRRIKHPSEVVKEGGIVDAYVLSIDVPNRKLSLTLKSMEKKEITFPNIDEIIDVTVMKIMPFGILAKVNDDITGLIPMGESAISKSDDVKSVFKEGSVIKVVVMDIDKERVRVTLSRKSYLDIKDKEEYRQYLKEQKNNTAESIGLLGQMIEASIKNKKS